MPCTPYRAGCGPLFTLSGRAAAAAGRFRGGGTSSAGPLFPFPGPAAALLENMIHLFLSKRKVFWAVPPNFRQKILLAFITKKQSTARNFEPCLKKGLRSSSRCDTIEAQGKLRQVTGCRHHPVTLCRIRYILHHSIAAPALIMSETPPFIKRRFFGGCVCSVAVWDSLSCAAFVCLGGSAHRGDREVPPPGYTPSRNPKIS